MIDPEDSDTSAISFCVMKHSANIYIVYVQFENFATVAY